MHDLSLIKAVLLGALQGATEFLPVSSSGHLVIAQYLLGIELEGAGLLAFDVCLHFGTLVAVLIVFRRDIIDICRGFINRPARGGASLEPKLARRLGLFIILGTIPAVIIGLGFEEFFERLVSSPIAAAVMLLVTGTILFGTRFVRRDGAGLSRMRWWHSLAIGLGQSLAIIPGISRSGTTISTGLYLGIDRTLAARFSFLLAVPVIAGATVLKLDDLAALSQASIIATIVGTVVAAIVGVVCIKWLLAIIRRGHFSWFAYYCWAAGLSSIAYLSFS